MASVDTAVVALLDTLERIADEHDELMDTDVREAVHATLTWYFVWGQPRTRFPCRFGMFSADGDRRVASALNRFLDAAERARDIARLSLGQARLDRLQSDAATTSSGASYDEFYGHVDVPDRKSVV